MVGSVVEGGNVIVVVSGGAAGAVVVTSVVGGADVGVVGDVGVCFVPPVPPV